jgi:glycosyltransferase involved in cell wall biosynthesis
MARRPPAPDRGLPLTLMRTAGEGAAGARNRGASRAAGEWLCFCDAHLRVADGWLDGLIDALRRTGAAAVCPAIARADNRDARGYGYTWTGRAEPRWLSRPPDGPAPVPFLPGACTLVRRSAFAAAGGYDGGLVPWGHEDSELSLALWLTGHDAVVAPDVVVEHHFRARHPYLVRADQVDANLARVGWIHFGPARAARFARAAGVAGRLPAVAASPTAQRRRACLLAARRRSDDWFCERFALRYWD